MTGNQISSTTFGVTVHVGRLLDEVGVLQKRSKQLKEELLQTRKAADANKCTEDTVNPFFVTKANQSTNPNAKFQVSLVIPREQSQ